MEEILRRLATLERENKEVHRLQKENKELREMLLQKVRNTI
jgi:cell shape-determining protein MreC